MRSRSSSTTSSHSSKSLLADNIQILVKISGGKTVPINVRPTNTVANVLEFLSASTTLPPDVRLLHAGHPLEASSTVAELNLQPSATLQLLSPLRGGTAPTDPESAIQLTDEMTATLPVTETKADQAITPASSGTATPTTNPSTPSAGTPTSTVRKSNKPRCSKVGCKGAAQPIVGDCGFCQKRFCGKHRMLESHACTGLDDARQADKDRNTAKLQGERTVMLRGL